MAGDPNVLLKEAEKLLGKASSGFSFFSKTQDNYEIAADKFKAAANAFRTQKFSIEGTDGEAVKARQEASRKAGQAFETAAQIQLQNLNEPDDAANMNKEAFEAYRTDFPEEAARCLDKTIAHYCSKGDFRRAADRKQDLAKLYEEELGDNTRAAAAIRQAAQWYEGASNAKAIANKLWLKTADLVALESKESKDYYEAIELYEKVAKASSNDNLMRYSTKEYLLKAGICRLCTGDQVGVDKALENYKDLDPSFAQQRECQLLFDLYTAVQESDEKMFSEKLFHYDQMSKLDKWKTTLLLRVKSTIVEAEEDFS